MTMPFRFRGLMVRRCFPVSSSGKDCGFGTFITLTAKHMEPVLTISQSPIGIVRFLSFCLFSCAVYVLFVLNITQSSDEDDMAHFWSDYIPFLENIVSVFGD